MSRKTDDPQTLFVHLRTLPLSTSILFLVLLCILGLFLTWGFFTWLPINVDGNGITINKQGLWELSSKTDGVIVQLDALPGQKVNRGDLLVKIQNRADLLKRESLSIKLESLEREYKRLKEQISIEESSFKNATRREITANEYSKDQLEKMIASLVYEKELRQKLFEKGLISYTPVRQTESELIRNEIEIENVKTTIALLYSDLVQGYRVNELTNKEWEIEDTQKELAVLENQMESGKIYSPENGRIIALLADIGEVVKLGDQLLLLESESGEDSSLIIRGYFSIENGANIKKGTPVQISFPQFNENEYGKIVGVVGSISDYAVSLENLYKTVYNKELIQTLIGRSAAVSEVVIVLKKNPDRPDEYLWTNPNAPKAAISTGLFCQLKATVEEKKPLYFILPLQLFKRIPVTTFEKMDGN